ncbi:hypothetical protein E4U17_004052 [Claviceps sp. LM77 group G4]|nr:hypothetical protein E4U17_004052 [Claviceps sp. LM77 group G4]
MMLSYSVERKPDANAQPPDRGTSTSWPLSPHGGGAVARFVSHKPIRCLGLEQPLVLVKL